MKTLRIAVLGLVGLLSLTPSTNAARYSKKAKARTLIQRGLKSLDRHEYDVAIKYFSKAVRRQRSAETYFLLGYSHYQRGFINGIPEAADRNDAAETIKAYNIAISIDPSLRTLKAPYRLYHSMALSYEALNANEKAVEAYRNAFLKAPRNPLLPLYAARMRFKLGDERRSAANFALSLRKAREVKKLPAVIRTVKRNKFFSGMLQSPLHSSILSQYEDLLAAERSRKSPHRAGGKITLAQASSNEYSHMLGLKDAVRDTRTDQRSQIIQETAQNSEVMKRLTAANEDFRFRHFNSAVDGYNETLVLNQRSGILNPIQLSLVYERMGASYNQLGLSRGAIKALGYAVQQMPNNSGAYYQLALAYSVSGKYADSLKSLQSAFQSAPSKGELRKLMLLSKTDTELEPIRDLPGFHRILRPFKKKVQARR